MKILSILLLHLFSLSLAFAAGDTFDVRMGLGDEFQNSQRSVYLKFHTLNCVNFPKIAFIMEFDVIKKETSEAIASMGINYYGETNKAIVFGIVPERLLTDTEMTESIQTAMGIFRSQQRSHLMFDRFAFGYATSGADATIYESILTFLKDNYKYIGDVHHSRFFEIEKR